MSILTRIFAAVFACTLLLVMGCGDNPLDLDPTSELPEDAVWEDPALVEAYLNDVYAEVGWGYGDPTIAGTADEAINTHGHGDAPSRLSNMTPDNLGLWGGWNNHQSIEKFRWEVVYSNVRDLNLFIQGVEQSEALDTAMKEQMLGEAYFLRGYFYHNLMRLHGGVPIIDEPFELGSDTEQYHVPRGSFQETIEFIEADLDRAAERLTLDARQPGAATQGAALALKSRVLLHAASDLFDPSTSPWPDRPEVAYQGGSQQDRWEAARDAAQAVMDLNEYDLDPAPTADEYHQLLVDGGGSETIWARYFTSDGGDAHNHSLWVSPNGYTSWSGDTPTQEHVDLYDMADGSEFSWEGGDPTSLGEDDAPVEADNPYEDRDPRLAANVLYNGAVWRPRPSGASDLDPIGIYQPGWYETEPGQFDPSLYGVEDESPLEGMQPGIDTREGPIENWNGTRSGYNLRKFVDQSIDPQSEQAYNPWIFLRYAEVLLNYAEASAELGNEGDARQALNEVRSRVGMPDVTASGQDLIDRIRNERAVELAFEEHRFFDIRRWMIAPEVYSEPARGILIVGELDDNGPSSVDVWEGIDEGHYTFRYKVRRVADREWHDSDRTYFVPIHQGEMDANPALEQNPGY